MPRSPSIRKKAPHRPQIEIDWTIVDKFIKAGSPGTEIAGYFCMHPQTFYDRFYIKYGIGFTEGRNRGDQAGCALLRARQYQSAMQGNTRMLEVLGKERLRQGQTISDPPNDAILGPAIEEAKKEGEIEALKEEINELKSQTSPEPLSSDSPL